MEKKYHATIKDGREIYIPAWPVQTQIENLTTLCKYLSDGSVINIAELNFTATKHAIMNADNPMLVADMIKHLTCQVRVAGTKVTPETFDTFYDGKLEVVVELFTHLVHSQYSTFFGLGEVKENSQ